MARRFDGCSEGEREYLACEERRESLNETLQTISREAAFSVLSPDTRSMGFRGFNWNHPGSDGKVWLRWPASMGLHHLALWRTLRRVYVVEDTV